MWTWGTPPRGHREVTGQPTSQPQGNNMRNRVFITGLAGIAAALIGAGSLMAHDNDDDNDHGRERARFPVSTELPGLQEVPSITTPASGNFRAWVDTKA